MSRIARPHLETLYERVREPVTLQAMNDNATVMYLERVRTRQCHKLPEQMVPRSTPHTTSGGKVLLAYGDRERLDRYLRTPLSRVTRYSITDPARLMVELRRTRRQGYGVSMEESRLGYVSVAVPIFGLGNCFAGAVSVGATTSARTATLLDAMRDASALISRDLCEIKVVA
jgi:DNA-binding IclR family transcriptional regulator